MEYIIVKLGNRLARLNDRIIRLEKEIGEIKLSKTDMPSLSGRWVGLSDQERKAERGKKRSEISTLLSTVPDLLAAFQFVSRFHYQNRTGLPLPIDSRHRQEKYDLISFRRLLHTKHARIQEIITSC